MAEQSYWLKVKPCSHDSHFTRSGCVDADILLLDHSSEVEEVQNAIASAAATEQPSAESEGTNCALHVLFCSHLNLPPDADVCLLQSLDKPKLTNVCGNVVALPKVEVLLRRSATQAVVLQSSCTTVFSKLKSI